MIIITSMQKEINFSRVSISTRRLKRAKERHKLKKGDCAFNVWSTIMRFSSEVSCVAPRPQRSESLLYAEQMCDIRGPARSGSIARSALIGECEDLEEEKVRKEK